MIRDIYHTSIDRYSHTLMAVSLGRDDESSTFGLSVLNMIENVTAWIIIDRAELLQLRDAITRELAS